MRKYGKFEDIELSEHITGSGDIVVSYIENEPALVEYLSRPEEFKLIQYDLPNFIDDLEGILKALKNNKTNFEALDIKTNYSYSILDNVRFTYKVIKRGPGLFDNTSDPFGGVRNYRPVKRLTARDPRAKDHTVIASQLFFDNVLQINVISKNYRNADEGAYFIEDFMERYRMVFLSRGLVHLRYMERVTDSVELENDMRTYICGLKYYVRTFKLYLTYERDLERLNILAKTNS